jgi:hypothetical protein
MLGHTIRNHAPGAMGLTPFPSDASCRPAHHPWRGSDWVVVATFHGMTNDMQFLTFDQRPEKRFVVSGLLMLPTP